MHKDVARVPVGGRDARMGARHHALLEDATHSERGKEHLRTGGEFERRGGGVQSLALAPTGLASAAGVGGPPPPLPPPAFPAAPSLPAPDRPAPPPPPHHRHHHRQHSPPPWLPAPCRRHHCRRHRRRRGRRPGLGISALTPRLGCAGGSAVPHPPHPSPRRRGKALHASLLRDGAGCCSEAE